MSNADQTRKTTFLFIALALLIALLYGQVLQFQFLHFDDPGYITNNEMVKKGFSWEGVRWAATATEASNWHPLTWISHMLDYQFFGDFAGGHHAVNVLLHFFNCLLIFAVLFKTTNRFWESAFVALLSAIHPLRVESVAWVSERKDVLFAMMGLLSLLYYADYAKVKRKAFLFISVFFFALSLLAKPMLVTFPFLLLLLDHWPLGRWGKENKSALVFEKIPFLCLSLASCMVTFAAQKKGAAVVAEMVIPIGHRIANAMISYAVYLRKLFVPIDLAGFYPYRINIEALPIILSGLVLASLLAACLYFWKRVPVFSIGLLWFFGVLVPVIGLVQVGIQSMADRYTYFPLIGLFIALVWGGSMAFEHFRLPRKIVLGLGTAALVFFSCLTFRQVGYWRNDITHYGRIVSSQDKHALMSTKLGSLAFSYLGIAYGEDGQTQKAVDTLEFAVKVNPDEAETHYHLGNVYLIAGFFEDARQWLNKALIIDENYVPALNALATLHYQTGEIAAAIEYQNKAHEVMPEMASVLYNLGFYYEAQRNSSKAIEIYKKVLTLDSGHKNAAARLLKLQDQVSL